ncbi:MAG TPA: 3-oxoacyl-ACP reductase [Anaeromyxobacteraceae bacterium]|jgi:3-oxoacyl-[acyl-carrier protein] reductase|nr:3-oxoacyl-ACP reductase [Anaeromyxobacteraceae bacterium]
MADRFMELAHHRVAGRLIRALGLPRPPVLARAGGAWQEQPLLGSTVAVGTTPGSFATRAVRDVLSAGGAAVRDGAPAEPATVDGAAFDATGLTGPSDARRLYDFFHPLVPRLAQNARLLVLAADPDQAGTPAAAAAARGVEGFVRSLAKEVGRRGATANLAYVARGGEARLAGPARFFCAAGSTYVSGQAVHVTEAVRAPASVPLHSALRGKVALVTGAARGIGAATAERLAQEGARVVCLDVAAANDALAATAARVGGEALPLDLTAPGAATRVATTLRDGHGGVDVVVHNAGITRDRTLAKMTRDEWDQVLAVNFEAIVALDDALLAAGTLRDEGRLVYLSSVSGVAGNFGQTNYAATKAALIGYVTAVAPRLAPRGVCANAVAPGFIETGMVARMPFVMREAGRRLNSLSQGGQPQDVAELVTFLASPGAYGITGATIRVCGQSLVGA